MDDKDRDQAIHDLQETMKSHEAIRNMVLGAWSVIVWVLGVFTIPIIGVIMWTIKTWLKL